jgi:hypothetical protein
VHALSRVSDFPAPTVGSNGLPSFGPTFNVNGGAPVFNAAQPVCKKDLPDIGAPIRPPRRRRPMRRRSSTPRACDQTGCLTSLIPTVKD